MSVTATSPDIQRLMDSVNGTGQKQQANAVSDAQNRFLKLLTTQLKNQDPLNPMDNAQMTSQLAQISTVDGIERLNATLKQLLSSSADTELMRAAALVGHQVMIAGSGLQLSDAGAVGGLELSEGADRVTVTIKDANGLIMNVVDLGELDAGVHNFVWDGKTDTGAQAVNGSYSIAVSATRDGEKVQVDPLQLAGVLSINGSNQGVSLNLGVLGLVSLDDIKQIF